MDEALRAIAVFVGTLLAVFVVQVFFQFRQGSAIKKAIEVPAQKMVDNTSAVSSLTTTLEKMSIGWLTGQQYYIDANTSLRADRDDQRRKNENLEAQIQDNRRRLDTYAQTVEGLMKDQEARTRASAQRDEQLKELTDKVGAMEAAQSGTQKDLERAQKDLEKTQADLNAALGRIAELESQRDSERTATAAEKTRLEKELQDERAKVASLEKQVQEQQGKIEALQGQVASLQTQLNAQKPVDLPAGITSTDPIVPVEAKP